MLSFCLLSDMMTSRDNASKIERNFTKTVYLISYDHACVREKGKWSSEGGATFGFSFVLVVLAAGVFMIDIAIIRVATRDPYKTKKVKT